MAILWLLLAMLQLVLTQECTESKYDDIVSQFHALKQQNSRIVLQKSRDSSLVQSQSYKDVSKQLDLSDLTKILEITKDTVTVQAKCRFEDLVHFTLRMASSMPAVVPEFKSITVGGAIAGGALESTSFRFGQVSDIAISYTLLLSNGTIVNVDQSHDLFHALPGSYGTLGILLDATLRMIPVQRYVDISLLKFENYETGLERLAHLATTPQYDFLDALYLQETLVICAGTFTDTYERASLINTEYSGSPWMYEHVEDALASNRSSVTLPISHYLFRYERGAFWMARPVRFRVAEIVRNPMLITPFFVSWRYMRRFFGTIFTATNLYRVLHQADHTAVAESFIIMDAYMPTATNATKLFEFVQSSIPISVPLWFCPVSPSKSIQPLSPTGSATQLIINVGIWGRVSDHLGKIYTKQLEEKVAELGGRKMLYSQSSLNETELYETMVDGVAYRRLRQQYDPDSVFPELHEKLQLTSGDASNSTKSFKYWITRLVL